MTGSIEAAAARLCELAGRPSAVSIDRLAGGKNNRVYRLDFAGGDRLIMKSYHTDPRDTRDRLRHEWEFLAYVTARGVTTVPQPLARDEESRSALYSFVPGRKADSDELGQGLIDQAAAFILAANAAPRQPEQLMPGSEACFSLSDHVRTIDRRVERLAALDDGAPHRLQAEELIGRSLIPLWTGIRQSIADVDSYGEALSAPQQCASPSDFGFHNALLDEAGKVTFIDFEYAGRDDPAKLVCDFFCCPEIPVPLRYWSSFIQRLVVGLAFSDDFRRRCELLIDAYRIKWACIILNDFLPLGAARRDFAVSDERSVRCSEQLRKTKRMLAEIGSR